MSSMWRVEIACGCRQKNPKCILNDEGRKNYSRNQILNQGYIGENETLIEFDCHVRPKKKQPNAANSSAFLPKKQGGVGGGAVFIRTGNRMVFRLHDSR